MICDMKLEMAIDKSVEEWVGGFCFSSYVAPRGGSSTHTHTHTAHIKIGPS